MIADSDGDRREAVDKLTRWSPSRGDSYTSTDSFTVASVTEVAASGHGLSGALLVSSERTRKRVR